MSGGTSIWRIWRRGVRSSNWGNFLDWGLEKPFFFFFFGIIFGVSFRSRICTMTMHNHSAKRMAVGVLLRPNNTAYAFFFLFFFLPFPVSVYLVRLGYNCFILLKDSPVTRKRQTQFSNHFPPLPLVDVTHVNRSSGNHCNSNTYTTAMCRLTVLFNKRAQTSPIMSIVVA